MYFVQGLGAYRAISTLNFGYNKTGNILLCNTETIVAVEKQ
jgi:hypothetical protein